MTEYERGYEKGYHDGMEEMRKRIQNKAVDEKFWNSIMEEEEQKKEDSE